MRRLLVTEAGESVVTPGLLLDLIAGAINWSAIADDFDSPTNAYLAASVNALAAQGYLSNGESPHPKGDSASIDTKEPPRFLSDAFREKERREDDDGGPGVAADL